jgi:hypothetical protein
MIGKGFVLQPKNNFGLSSGMKRQLCFAELTAAITAASLAVCFVAMQILPR